MLASALDEHRLVDLGVEADLRPRDVVEDNRVESLAGELLARA